MPPKNHKRTRWLVGAVTALLATVLGLSACRSERPQPIIERPTQRVTDEFLTEVALENATPTPGPSPTPTTTPTPYQTPTPFPDADPDMVVAQVGDRAITLAEFQARVRYERWLPFYAIARDIPDLGLELLDLTRPQNTNTLALLYTLNEDPHALGRQVLNAMITDQIVLREAGRMDLDVEQTIFDGRLAARLDVELGRGGARPSNWDEAYQRFIEDMQLYTGMSEAQFREHVLALAYYQQLSEIIGERAPLPTDEVANEAIIQDIILDSREDAVEVKERLEAGEDMVAIAASFGQATSEGTASRTVTRQTEGLTDDLLNAIFDAQPNDVVGPIATEAGWYVAKVADFQLNMASPADLEATKEQYYLDWIISRMDDPDYTQVVETEQWRPFVPTDPLPQDISPYLRDENFVLPPNPFETAPGEPTPTPLPLGNSPR